MVGKTLSKRWLINIKNMKLKSIHAVGLAILLSGVMLTGCQINSPAPLSAISQPAVSTGSTVLVHATNTEKGSGLVLRQKGERVQAQRNTNAMPGLFILPSRQVVSVSTLNLQPGKENVLSIKWSDLTLTPLAIDKLTLVEYDMPTMPEMGGPFTATLNKKSATEVEATLDIAHGGYWEMNLVFEDGAKQVVKVGIDIPKGKGR